ncbi:hypothetical protein LXL04_007891 [Taraxacum kok-saghyz]
MVWYSPVLSLVAVATIFSDDPPVLFAAEAGTNHRPPLPFSVTKTEGRTSRNTAATTPPQLRRSDRGTSTDRGKAKAKSQTFKTITMIPPFSPPFNNCSPIYRHQNPAIPLRRKPSSPALPFILRVAFKLPHHLFKTLSYASSRNPWFFTASPLVLLPSFTGIGWTMEDYFKHQENNHNSPIKMVIEISFMILEGWLYLLLWLQWRKAMLLWVLEELGLSHMAYPGAVYSRFEHSFGVYWLAGNVVEKLKAHQQVIQGSKWIPLSPSDDDMFPFKLRRKQFPVRLCFAMMINKAQGQTISNVGVYLPEPVFSHGQLYVALSRGISRGNTKVLVKSVEKSNVDEGYTSNVVYKEVLSD